MLENTMKNQCFFMKFQQALCRITTFEQKTLKYNGKSTICHENRETPIENACFAIKITNIYENQ
tara:strand:+ start:201 stop:392 length:192 start_codon:yes stop_codon:yes gene_type:complete